MQTYGWASDGESFSIGDPNELWIMEIVGKGNASLGTVWVAQRIPDGAILLSSLYRSMISYDWGTRTVENDG